MEKRADDKGFLYLASKLFAERAAWDAQKAPGVRWDLVAINPVICYGPLVYKLKSLSSLNESLAIIWNGFLHGKKPEDEIPPNRVPLYVDVRVGLFPSCSICAVGTL